MLDGELLSRFEAGLDLRRPTASAIPATVVDYGEISAIFRVAGIDGLVFKRMPLFSSRSGADRYAQMVHTYCQLLSTAGLHLPPLETIVVALPARPVVLYIAQQHLPDASVCHRLIKRLDLRNCRDLMVDVVTAITDVWRYNALNAPQTELAIDGQLSNWARPPGGRRLMYIDISTPLYRLAGIEQQDPELLLQSAPGVLRWVIRLLFLHEVMNRYYVPRLVAADLAANLYKEQLPELVPMTVAAVNAALPSDDPPLTVGEVKRYYRQDKQIWRLFLGARRLDRWIKTRVLKRRYDFLLPGRIQR